MESTDDVDALAMGTEAVTRGAFIDVWWEEHIWLVTEFLMKEQPYCPSSPIRHHLHPSELPLAACTSIPPFDCLSTHKYFFQSCTTQSHAHLQTHAFA